MSERIGPELENSRIPQEKEVLTKEKTFLENRRQGEYVGLLTNANVNVISSLYPQVIEGIMGVYNFIEKEPTDPASIEGFLNRHLRNLYSTATTLLSNEEVEKIREGIKSGKYSQQYEAYARFRNAASDSSSSASSSRNGRFDSYKRVNNDDDIVYNKRACLSRIRGMQSDLMELYGEVDFKKALLAEMIISAPFIDTVLSGDHTDRDTEQQHEAYIAEAKEFCAALDLDKRILEFVELTENYPVQWTYERPNIGLSDFDKEYLHRIYELSGKILSGESSIDDVYSILSETSINRGRVFSAQIIRINNAGVLEILPEEPEDVSFDDIAGYDSQKNFFLTLLEKTAEGDPMVEDIRIIIAAGKPGLGKSLQIAAFLKGLPENARGFYVKNKDMEVYKALMKIAVLHPNLQIFPVLEDMDAVAGNRLFSPTTSIFLEIESVGSSNIPRNLHLLASTNRPDIIDPAVTRPGRTSKILVYKHPDNEERAAIVRLHAKKYGYEFSVELTEYVERSTNEFTPAELKHIVWSLRFDKISDPTEEDIDKYIKDIKAVREIEIEAERAFGLKK